MTVLTEILKAMGLGVVCGLAVAGFVLSGEWWRARTSRKAREAQEAKRPRYGEYRQLFGQWRWVCPGCGAGRFRRYVGSSVVKAVCESDGQGLELRQVADLPPTSLILVCDACGCVLHGEDLGLAETR